MTPEQEKEFKSKISGFFDQIDAVQKEKEFGLTDVESTDIFIALLEDLVADFRSKARELKDNK